MIGTAYQESNEQFKVMCLSIILLLATAPWFFLTRERQILGFPCWAFYSMCMSMVYAIVISIIFFSYWNMLAGSKDEEL